MKIISQFKDYYDYVQHVYGGGDPKIVYNRTKKFPEFRLNNDREIVLKDKVELMSRIAIKGDYREFTDPDWLIVCGKPFPIVWRNGYPLKYEVLDRERHKDIIGFRSDNWLSWNGDKFTEVGVENEQLVNLSRAVGEPVFIVTRIVKGRDDQMYHVEVIDGVPNLSEMGLAPVYPAEQLYQDLSYFIANRINPSPDMAPATKMTDKEKVQQHGFDVKKSFRHRK